MGFIIRKFWGLRKEARLIFPTSFWQTHCSRRALLRALRGRSSIMLNLCSPMLSPCLTHALPVSPFHVKLISKSKKCCLISEEFGINGYSLFGGFPDGAGFPLQSFLRPKRLSDPIPNPLRLRGLREEAEWESLIRNFWGLGNRHASFFQPHFGRRIALGEAALPRLAPSMLRL